MSRAIHRRLLALEHRAAPPVSHVVIIPKDQWPNTEADWSRIHAEHPEGRFFVPSTMTLEEWDSIVPGEQAALKADPIQHTV